MSRVIGQRRVRRAGCYPDSVCVVARIERGRKGEARTMYVLADTAGHPQETLSRASWLRLARPRMPTRA